MTIKQWDGVGIYMDPKTSELYVQWIDDDVRIPFDDVEDAIKYVKDKL